MANAPGDQKRYRPRISLQVAGIYVVIGALWIFFSDRLAEMLARTSHHLVEISMAKGWLFVFSTAFLIYLLINRGLKEVEKSQEALRQSEERFRTMFELASVGMAQADPHTGRWQRVNQSLCAITGYSAQELVGKRFLDITYPEDRQHDWEDFQRMVQGEKPAYRNEKRYVRKDGTIVWVNENVTVVDDDSGQPLYSLAVIEDITARKQAETALQESERRFRRMAETVGEVFWLAPLGYQSILYINPAFEQIWGRSCADLYANPMLWLEAVHPEDVPRLLVAMEDLDQGKPYNIEYRIIRPDGEVRWINDRGYQMQDSSGRAAYTTGVASDITDRKVAEMAWRESEQRVRLKLDSILSPDGDLGNLEMADIIDVQALQSLMNDFYNLTHFPTAIIDLQGKVLVGVGWQDICTKFHRTHPETCAYCLESDTQLSQGVPPGEVRLYQCKNHMWDIATPIVVGGLRLGNLFAGQFFFDDVPLDYELFRAQARRYGFNEEEYLAALERVPRLSKESVDAGMAFLVKLSSMLSLLSYSNIKLARSLTERAALTDSLRESQERLSLALVASHMGVWEWNVEGDSLFWSPECFEIYGLEPVSNSSLTLEAFVNLVHPEDRASVMTAAETALAEKQGFGEDFRIIRPSGEVRWISSLARPRYDKKDRPLRMVGTVRDITEHKQADEALQAEAIRRRILVEQSRDGIVVMDEKGKVYEANQRFAHMLGYSAEEVRDLHVWDWDALWSRPELEEIIRVVGVDGDHFETRHRRKDGTVFDVEISSNAAMLAGQKLIFCVCRDISQRKAAEELLRQSEARLSRAEEMALLGHWDLDLKTQELTWSKEIYRLFGENPDSFLPTAEKFFAMILPEDREHVKQIREAALAEGRGFKVEYRTNKANGSLHHIQEKVEISKDEAGHPIRIFGTSQDITERKRAEEALSQNHLKLQETAQELEQSRNMLQFIIESIPVRVFWKGNGLRYLGCNTAFARDAGFSHPQQLLGKDDFALGWREQAERYRADDRRVMETRCAEINIVEPQTTPSGAMIWLNTSKVPLQLPNGEVFGVLGVYEDITERKQAEDVLAQQTQFLQLLIDTIPIPIFYKDEQGRYLGCNRAFKDFYGMKDGEIIGKTVGNIFSGEEADNYHQIDLELLRNPGVRSYDYMAQRHDGSKRDIVMKEATFLKSDGRVGGLIGVLTDITENKRAEKQLRALSTRMAEVEEEERQHLARELHDQVCQNLAILGITIETLKLRATKEPLDRLLSRIGDVSALVEQTGEVTRELMEGLRPTVLDHYGLLECLRRWASQFSKRTGISVEVQGEEAAPRLSAPVELALFRIAQEGLNNVAKHSRASRVVLSEAVDRHTVRLEIADNGVGFDPKQVRQPEGRHRWGLMTMSERALAVGGQCHIDSSPGEGTRVVVEVSRGEL